ncbi:PLP-dependent aminotransferase family protein [Pseudonocardia kunmingensis]|uniref:GntR family transcriptional regulator n=1 Tax=Pseudonocardia kunmingensis TaxID=630975 RepID=A0A543DKB7_9PSEU|nr:PLP-dependent aminotransferase family protein [Pseudonocardia kunmingensis]TQM09772.1 GntR family transcriptional regulator [Pseudonocardia kunmingensis]
MTETTGAGIDGTNSGLRIELADVRAQGARDLTGSLAEALRQAVRGGRLPAGTRLPASRGLAADLGVSRGVVVRAYEQLVAEGYLHAHTGRGTVVSEVHAAAGGAPPPVRPFDPGNPGVPALGSFPRAEWMRALETAMRSLPDAELGYGDPRGHPRLRRALAAYLGRTRAVVAPLDRIVVTGGYAQAARLAAEALVRHGVPAVGVEDPGSVGVIETLRIGGLATTPVPVDEHGIDVAALAATDLRAVAVTPAHQFPTGAVLAPARRTALLDWAAERDAVVFEDDYDAEYRYDRSPVGALQGLAPDRVVYGGSISKTLAPGLRLGWLVAPAWLAATLTEVKHWADIAEPVLDQVALAVFIESGALDRHIRRMASLYAARRRALLAAVARHLPGWAVTGVAAGLHAVLVPARPLPAAALDAMAHAPGGLRATPLAAYTQAVGPRPGLVVGYGAVTTDRIERGIAAMADAAP